MERLEQFLAQGQLQKQGLLSLLSACWLNRTEFCLMEVWCRLGAPLFLQRWFWFPSLMPVSKLLSCLAPVRFRREMLGEKEHSTCTECSNGGFIMLVWLSINKTSPSSI